MSYCKYVHLASACLFLKNKTIYIILNKGYAVISISSRSFRTITIGDLGVHISSADETPIVSPTGSRKDKIEYTCTTRIVYLNTEHIIILYTLLCSGINPTDVAVTSSRPLFHKPQTTSDILQITVNCALEYTTDDKSTAIIAARIYMSYFI